MWHLDIAYIVSPNHKSVQNPVNRVIGKLVYIGGNCIVDIICVDCIKIHSAKTSDILVVMWPWTSVKIL